MSPHENGSTQLSTCGPTMMLQVSRARYHHTPHGDSKERLREEEALLHEEADESIEDDKPADDR